MNPLANSSTTGDSQPETSKGESSVSAENSDAFRWNVRPSDNEPSKRWGVLLAALFAFGLGFLLFRNFTFGILGFLIILIATAEYWLGTSYKVDSKGASARTGFSLTSLTWEDVKRAVETAEGIKLSPLGNSGRMEAFRGVFLKYGTQSAQVKEAVRRWLPTNVELMGG